MDNWSVKSYCDGRVFVVSHVYKNKEYVATFSPNANMISRWWLQRIGNSGQMAIPLIVWLHNTRAMEMGLEEYSPLLVSRRNKNEEWRRRRKGE